MAPSGQDQQQQRKAGEHGTQSQHHPQGKHQHEPRQHLHNPTGYTDEVADEEREFMMQAERSAGQSEDTNTSSQSLGQDTKSSKKGGLESSMGSSGSQGGMGQKAGETMENIKNKAKDTLNM
ncbi:hypothetical protein GE09DRAFT_1214877 [Coniochaeta sp. 2T2.1]|nr:hypothetical protein GE09DRAFT_1214877 [Coniochaeta sp. 2T2.1]